MAVLLSLLAAYIAASSVGLGAAFLLIQLGAHTGVAVLVGLGAAVWALIATYRFVAKELRKGTGRTGD